MYQLEQWKSKNSKTFEFCLTFLLVNLCVKNVQQDVAGMSHRNKRFKKTFFINVFLKTKVKKL
jgi:hypothetical protein